MDGCTLLTGINCPACEVVKKRIKRPVRMIDINTADGMAEATLNGVSTIPALVTPWGVVLGTDAIVKAINGE